MYKEKLSKVSSEVMINQIDSYYKVEEYILPAHKYRFGDDVFLKKGTLLHGTYKNLEGLKEIVRDGLMSSWLIKGRESKYPSSVGVWNLKKDYLLKDYINFYSGGTIKYFNQSNDIRETEVVSFDDMSNIMNKIISKNYLVWGIEQTKEARFLPSLVQNQIQIGIIFNSNNIAIEELLKGDVLNPNNIDDIVVKDFVNEKYYDQFIIDRKNRDDLFTDRESAVLFGIPANLIEGILVGREYENDSNKLSEIKSLLPKAYKVIVI